MHIQNAVNAAVALNHSFIRGLKKLANKSANRVDGKQKSGKANTRLGRGVDFTGRQYMLMQVRALLPLNGA